MGSRWDRYWFGEGSLVRLGAFRIVMMVTAFYAVWHFRIGVFQHADGVDVGFLSRSWNPIYAFEMLGVDPPGPTTARVVYWTLLSAIVLGTIGLFSRVACTVVAVLTFYWIGAHYSFGKPHHDCIALMLGLIALPFGPVGARLSVDSLLRRLRAAKAGGDPLTRPETAEWAALPIRFTQITAALGYFFAGATKLVLAGPGWANGYTLQGIMLEYNSPWSEALASNILVLTVMSAGLLFVQVSFPLVFVPGLRWFYVPMAIVFHLMAMQTMATGSFITLWFTLACFVDLERVPAFLSRTVASGPFWRRIAVGGALVGFAWLTFQLYFKHVPLWLALPLVPLAVTCLLGLLPQLKREIRFDPRDAAARRRVAWLDAFDGSNRLTFRTDTP